MDYHFYYPDTPANRKFVQDFQAAYGNPPGFPAFHGFLTARFIAAAFEKAGTVDREKFVDALEGLTSTSPVGPVQMRACDHQAVLPIYLGVTRQSPTGRLRHFERHRHAQRAGSHALLRRDRRGAAVDRSHRHHGCRPHHRPFRPQQPSGGGIEPRHDPFYRVVRLSFVLGVLRVPNRGPRLPVHARRLCGPQHRGG